MVLPGLFLLLFFLCALDLREELIERLFPIGSYLRIDLDELLGDLARTDGLSPAFPVHDRVEPDTACKEEFPASCTGNAFLRGNTDPASISSPILFPMIEPAAPPLASTL